MVNIRLVLLLTFYLLVAGCWLDKVHTLRQEEQPVGTFTVRVNVGPDERLVMVEEFEADSGEKSTVLRKNFGKCEYIDENNWTCEGARANERVVMASGILTHFFDGEQRTFKRGYRLSLFN